MKLVESDDFKLEMPVDDLDVAGPVRRITIPADSSISVSFPVRMTTIGDVDIKVVALSNRAYDSLIRTVHVNVRFVYLIICKTLYLVLFNTHSLKIVGRY